jgi:hypothetical protein
MTHAQTARETAFALSVWPTELPRVAAPGSPSLATEASRHPKYYNKSRNSKSARAPFYSKNGMRPSKIVLPNADKETSHDWLVPVMSALLLTSVRARSAAEDQVLEK